MTAIWFNNQRTSSSVPTADFVVADWDELAERAAAALRR